MRQFVFKDDWGKVIRGSRMLYCLCMVDHDSIALNSYWIEVYPVGVGAEHVINTLSTPSAPAGLCGPFSVQLCSLRGLRRLCICRCGLTGKIPSEIGGCRREGEVISTFLWATCGT